MGRNVHPLARIAVNPHDLIPNPFGYRQDAVGAMDVGRGPQVEIVPGVRVEERRGAGPHERHVVNHGDMRRPGDERRRLVGALEIHVGGAPSSGERHAGTVPGVAADCLGQEPVAKLEGSERANLGVRSVETGNARWCIHEQVEPAGVRGFHESAREAAHAFAMPVSDHEIGVAEIDGGAHQEPVPGSGSRRRKSRPASRRMVSRSIR